jgi:glycosyltransferase involved in cell wall biosynthesis
VEVSFYRYSLLSRGGDKMVVEYANYLAAKGYNITLWYSNLNTVFKLHPQLRLAKIPIPTKLGAIIYASLKKFQSNAIVVDIIPLASVVSSRNRSRLIYFAQDYDESYYRNPIKKLLIKFFYFFCLRFIKIKTIAVSSQLAQVLREKYEADAKTVENGIDLNVFYPDPDEELMKIKGNKKAVLILSRNEYRKGFDIALKVINELSDRWKDKIEIWTCGEELKGDILKAETRSFGWVNEDKLRKIVSSADVLFYPTRHEGLPLFPLEAMACGCPVVTTKAVTYAKDGHNALVAEIEDVDNLKEKLESILRDDILKERLQKNGFKTVKECDIKESQMKFEKAVADIFHLNSNLPRNKPTSISSK